MLCEHMYLTAIAKPYKSYVPLCQASLQATVIHATIEVDAEI